MNKSLHHLTDQLLNASVAITFLYLLLVPMFWIGFVLKHFRSSWKEYVSIKRLPSIDKLIQSKIEYNYKTVLFKDLALLTILVLEWLLHLYTLIIFGTSHIIRHRRDALEAEISLAFNKCAEPGKILFFIGVSYTKPVIFIYPIVLVIMFVTYILLFSFLCTYLKRRYCGYSLDNRVVSKYVVWWCVQAALLFLCAIPYTQILLTVVCPILLLINWTLLVAESRRLSRAIRSVLYEIKHFERDDVRYSASYASYRTYRIFISIQLTGILVLIVLCINLCVYYLLEVLLVNNCYLELLYNYEFGFLPKQADTQQNISKIISSIHDYATFLLFLSYSAIMILPRVAFLLKWGLHSLVKRLTYKRNPIRFNQAILKPLLPKEVTV